MSRCKNFHFRVGALLVVIGLGGGISTANGQTLEQFKNGKAPFKGKFPLIELLSSGGGFAMFGKDEAVHSVGETKRGGHDHGRGGNTFVNDPCLDPPAEAPFPTNFTRTMQSETEIAVLNARGSMGKKMVAGYNDSWGFYDNRQGLSGYAYSVDGGNKWIDGGGLPPRVTPAPGAPGIPAGTPGADAYFGDPVVVVHHQTGYFYYASLYQSQAGYTTLSVNRGSFQEGPPHNVESISNTRCANDPTEYGVPDIPNQKERIIWEPPVEAVLPPNLGPPFLFEGELILNPDFLDKEWLYVDQNTGYLYMTYTRFTPLGETPIELVVSYDQGETWTTPRVIVPNELDTFNQATQPFTTPTGRLIVTWFARRFPAPSFVETEQKIEYAYSDDDGLTWSGELPVSSVFPQGEPPGYNRGRPTILNAPYIFVDRGEDDGVFTSQEQSRPGFGNIYISYFSGKTPLSNITRAADIFVSTSRNNGTSFDPPVKVNDDNTNTVHVFPSVQANKLGDVYAAWIDRRQDPDAFIPPTPGPPPTPAGGGNIYNDVYAAVSKNFGSSFGHNKLQTTVSTSWFTRTDGAPNFGDYNSSELLGFNQFVTIWADGRFPTGTFIFDRPPFNPCPEPPAVCDPPPVERLRATPDVIFTISQGLGAGNDPNPDK
jgi:hypothetical protein